MKCSLIVLVGAVVLAALTCHVEARNGGRMMMKTSSSKKSKKGKTGTIFFDDGNISIGMDDDFLQLVIKALEGLRILGQNANNRRRRLEDGLLGPARIFFGPTDECRITVNPNAATGPLGMMLEDPFGVRLVDPTTNSPSQLTFGPTDECRIFVGPLLGRAGRAQGMIFEDPEGFLFRAANQPVVTMTVEGNIQAQFIVSQSSRRFKENIRDMENMAEKVMQLRGVYFDWVPEKGGYTDLGLIAEEVAEVFPEAVMFEESKDGSEKKTTGVRYGHLVAVVIEAFKEQNQVIKELNAKLTKHQQEIEAKEKRLQSLEAEFKLLKEQFLQQKL